MNHNQKIVRISKVVLGPSIFLFLASFIIYTGHNPSSTNRNGSLKIVRTESGLVSGVQTPTPGVLAFKGIPYAAAPVGKLRWHAPEPPQKWDGVLKADHFCQSCMQASQSEQANPPGAHRKSVWTKPFLIPEGPLSENCLYLNIWTAAQSSTERRPVIVWIHGGGFQSGSGSVPVYNGEAMAKKGVVFVTINYRLGVFGFLALPELSDESDHHTSGNYGLLDQIAALKWVKKNIAAFGGNPDNVTIDGQSAGAFSVNYLVASPLAKGLFQRAIAESGASFVANPFNNTPDLQTAEKNGLKFMKSAGAGSLEKLREMPAETLLKLRGSFNPIIDGYVLPEKISAIFAQGRQNDVPTLTGWNADEGTAFSIYTKPLDAPAFKKQAEQTYGSQANKFLQYYPAQTDKEAMSSQYAVIRDLLFATQNYTWANLQSKTGNAKVYLYTFDRKLPAVGAFRFFGAFHSGEIAYALDNLKYLNRPWKPVDRELANIMSSYWVNFATTGNPNGRGLPVWPAYRPAEGKDMELGEKSGYQAIPNKAAMDFLVGYFVHSHQPDN